MLLRCSCHIINFNILSLCLFSDSDFDNTQSKFLFETRLFITQHIHYFLFLLLLSSFMLLWLILFATFFFYFFSIFYQCPVANFFKILRYCFFQFILIYHFCLFPFRLNFLLLKAKPWRNIFQFVSIQNYALNFNTSESKCNIHLSLQWSNIFFTNAVLDFINSFYFNYATIRNITFDSNDMKVWKWRNCR